MMPSSVTRSSPPQRGQDVDIARSRLGFAMAVTVWRPSDSGKSLGGQPTPYLERDPLPSARER